MCMNQIIRLRLGPHMHLGFVGDTYPLGCALDEFIVHHKVIFSLFNHLNVR
jgi:hypothetical protein